MFSAAILNLKYTHVITSVFEPKEINLSTQLLGPEKKEEDSYGDNAWRCL